MSGNARIGEGWSTQLSELTGLREHRVRRPTTTANDHDSESGGDGALAEVNVSGKLPSRKAVRSPILEHRIVNESTTAFRTDSNWLQD
ncbi:hypothetical protein [Thalassoglobus neptunius]|uniref:hypothetical protein n=1 Tax=Thalassoglobus neptunius TaxID=1938619 RepID=UPI0011B573B0|nr:hypothetical protein [Thalassoglobus neptunius]